MKHPDKKHQSYLFIILLSVLAACTKNEIFIDEYATDTGVGYYPQSANTLVDMATNANLNNATYAAGANFKTEIQYISQTPVKEINFYTTVGTTARTKVLTVPYAAAHSVTKGTDTLLVPYTVPTGLAVGTSIKLEYEILNQNNLNLIKTATIRTR